MRVEEQNEQNQQSAKIKRKNIFQGYRIALEDMRKEIAQGKSFAEVSQEMQAFLEFFYAQWDQNNYPFEEIKEKHLFEEWKNSEKH